ncbi:hypothetical protein FTO74_01350 [Granulicella sp. WH15]|uniref:hypothetical protein n=1 Tax=Granulicella sp. WH15 TaxID=2602070 RepID=UPI0013671370|nr:hypothetical protein [Granulicella sp. WH15]QHN02174.1 hypothetical protein FTO74_01350 [Granulicella sp. WH15]
MRSRLTVLLLFAMLTAPLLGQASAIPSAAPAPRSGETEEQHGRRLLDEMVKALGGQAWLNRGSITEEGKTAAFFRNQPNGSLVQFVEYVRPVNSPLGPAERFEYLTVRGMIMPGMKKDVVHLWTKDQGYELTFKGRTELPKPQVTDYLRRRAHSIDEVMHSWVNAPGVMVLAEGTGMRDRHLVDKVSILAPDNDTVEIELDATTHLPVQRTFEWRNDQFKDHDVDEETYTGYQPYDGIQTPLNITRYRNGDMVSQIFILKVKYGPPLGPDLFDPDKLPVKK